MAMTSSSSSSSSSTRAENSLALVTGAAGFLGSHLVDRLLADGMQVIGVDNEYTGSKKNLATAEAHPHFSYLHHDVRDPLTPALSAAQQTVIHAATQRFIFHFACPASPVHYQRDPIFTTTTAVQGTLRALEWATAQHATIVIASTSEVYGDPVEHPQTEKYWGHVNPCGVRSCYDEGKRCAESVAMDFHRMHGTRVKIVRIFNTYGPRMDPADGRVVSNFIVAALRHQPLTMFGDGAQTRSLCYVDDLIDGIVRFARTPAAATGPLNLGNPDERTIADLAAQILRALPTSRSTILHHPLPSDDPHRRAPNIDRAQSLLQWTPRTSLTDGLQRTIAYFRLVLGEESR